MKNSWTLLLTMLVCLSCGIDSDVLNYSSSTPIDEGLDILLLYPLNNTEVKDGTSISATESRLVFEWTNNGENDFSPYNLELVNLSNNDTVIYESIETMSTINLLRDVNYSWTVTGISDSKSETWVFYNIGPDYESSSPFPAIAISPVSGASISQTSTTVNLIWKAEDEDNDILKFDLYFGESENPAILHEDINASRYNGIPVEAGKTYYWKIVTKDSVGNESTSEVFNFSVG
ncbi:hypothetical protein [Maribacter litoralis]|uniref:Fibronectin type-III domain-containing protein n=1 Tax=Maribacter litoralis TaxID=2059726 RepID=A0A653V8P4_9FLAO|nr:hypothetical protein [Maribacter litoralis]VXC02602.1 conserved hypothetical protein [Maribacter litoralis]